MIDLLLEGGCVFDEQQALIDDAAALLEALSVADRELSLVLCDDAFVRSLNQQWRGIDRATDVLSFPQEAPPGLDPATFPLGDVVISLDHAEAQAHARGHDRRTEIRVLLAHGLLHLLGHDHHDPASCQQMAREEVRLLQRLGVEVGGLVARSGVLGEPQR